MNQRRPRQCQATCVLRHVLFQQLCGAKSHTQFCSRLDSVGRFSGAGFARVNAHCNLSRKKSRKVAASLPGGFLSTRCSTLCITMEVEPRIAKQYKCHSCCSCKNYRGKGMEGGNKVSLSRFFVFCLFCFLLTRRSRVREKMRLGHPIARATSYCLLPDAF